MSAGPLAATAANVRALAERERMFRRVSKVLVAVSGGADSLACLLVLREVGRDLGFEVAACHFDHQLRPDSRADLDFVKATCGALGIECVSGEGDVAGQAARMRRGVEEIAREMRYQFLAFIAEKEGADCIATGHTADDQAETILMRIVRGSGVRGIRGMLPVSEVPGSPAQRLVRPLLETNRVTTEAICAEAGLTPLHDPSNADTAYTRNRVRHEVLPALEALNPSVRGALVGLGESAREAFEPIEKRSFEVQPAARTPIGAMFDATALAALPTEAIGLVIEREASFFHLEPEANRTQLQNLRAVFESGTGKVVFGDTEVEVSCGRARIGPELTDPDLLPETVLNVPGDTRAGPWRVTLRMEALPGSPETPVAAVESASTRGVLRARRLAPGDRIRWQGMERKVSDLLINEKLPAWDRPGMVAIADADGIVALFASEHTFARDAAEPDLWIRLSPLG